MAAALALFPGAGVAAEPPPKAEDCLACHADKDLTRAAPAKGRAASVYVDESLLKGSAHAALECVACHKTATAPHDERLPAVTCAGCHETPRTALGNGVHGNRKTAGGRAPLACAACHGTHGVRRAASLTIAACEGCHAKQVGLYRESVHGRSRQRGDQEAATCGSCHGATHTLAAKADPQAPTYHLNLPRTCAQCHADPELAKRHGIQVGAVYQLYMDSIHGRAVTRSGLLVAANCSDCHGAHEIRASTDAASRVYRTNIPGTCATCHAGIHKDYAESVHGRAAARGNSEAPVCTDCHSAHQIRRVEGAPWQLDVIRECGTCHKESLKTYRDTFHGKVTQIGLARVAKCADCHGSHTIQPVSDPRSKVSPANIVSTCKQCHPAATPAFAQFHPHADASDRVRFPRLYYVNLLMVSLLVGTFVFFGLHTLLWLPRSLVERFRRRPTPPEETPDR
jgi:DnaJ-class molecular chaperone